MRMVVEGLEECQILQQGSQVKQREKQKAEATKVTITIILTWVMIIMAGMGA